MTHWKFHGIHNDRNAGPYGRDRTQDRFVIRLWTEGGRNRDVELTPDDLLKIATDALQVYRIYADAKGKSDANRG